MIPTISNFIIDTLYPTPELFYLSCSTTFDGWFDIPFKDTNCFTCVRSLHSTKF